jgi:hypothetical protein
MTPDHLFYALPVASDIDVGCVTRPWIGRMDGSVPSLRIACREGDRVSIFRIICAGAEPEYGHEAGEEPDPALSAWQFFC